MKEAAQTMRISVGSDESNPVVDQVVKILKAEGHKVDYFGPKGKGLIPWPEVARRVASDVNRRHAQEGVLFCWTGTGVSIAANKFPGIRAALCVDAETARGARLWNNANILCISLRLTSVAVAQEIIHAWLNTKYQPNPEDDACVAEIREIEEGRWSDDSYGP
jgi:ribose 5-phosphate isomerase B